MTGKIYSLIVFPSDTITDIKNMICIVTVTPGNQGVPPYMQHLIFAGKQLEDNRTISDYNIKEDSIIHMVLILRGGMFHESSRGIMQHASYVVDVNVHDLLFQIEVEPCDTIADIKFRVQEALHFSTDACMLVFDKEHHQKLQDACTLADYNIHIGSVLHLVPSSIE